MNTKPSPIQKKTTRVKSIIFIMIAAIIAFGFYAWQRQQMALKNFESLKNSGVNITFSLLSRPLLAVDTQQSCIYLVSGDKGLQPTRIPFHDIEKIVFQEPKRPPQKSTDTSTPGSLTIYLRGGNQHRVGDLPGREDGAKQALALFEQHAVLVDKLSLKLRD